MSKIRIGIVGCGTIGNVQAGAYHKTADAEISALCDILPEKLKAAAERCPGAKTYADYHQLLADPDVDAVSV